MYLTVDHTHDLFQMQKKCLAGLLAVAQVIDPGLSQSKVREQFLAGISVESEEMNLPLILRALVLMPCMRRKDRDLSLPKIIPALLDLNVSCA